MSTVQNKYKGYSGGQNQQIQINLPQQTGLLKKLHSFLYFASFTNKLHSVATTPFKMLITDTQTYVDLFKNKICFSSIYFTKTGKSLKQNKQLYKNNFFNPDIL